MLNATEPVQRMHQHRVWVTGQLLAAADGLSAEDLERSFPIGQGSIWKSLLHLYAAEHVWLAALEGEERAVVPGDLPGVIPGNQQGENAIQSLDELKREWARLDARWQRYLQQLQPADLEQLVAKRTSTGDGKRHETRCLDILLHVCLHAHYTTAQTMNMLRQAGANTLPDPMLISLARQEMAGQ